LEKQQAAFLTRTPDITKPRGQHSITKSLTVCLCFMW